LLLFLTPSPGAAGDPLPGKWKNTDENTRGLRRLVISKDGNDWIIQTWGSGGGGAFEIDQGKTKLHILGDNVGDKSAKYGFATWDHGFKETHLTLGLENGNLIVEGFNIFKDKSGRANYRSKYEFKKQMSD
jgi:hypothetical protein